MKAIALDLDGTLIDCRERQCLVTAALCRAASAPFDIEQFWSAKRGGSTTHQALTDQQISEDTAALIAKLWIDVIEGDQWLRYDRPYQGVDEALHGAKAKGWTLHLITARASRLAVQRQLFWLGWAQLFETITVVSPKAAGEQKARQLMQISPQVFIGDAESDAVAAELARICFIAVYSGQRSRLFWSERFQDLEPVCFPTVTEAVELYLAD